MRKFIFSLVLSSVTLYGSYAGELCNALAKFTKACAVVKKENKNVSCEDIATTSAVPFMKYGKDVSMQMYNLCKNACEHYELVVDTPLSVIEQACEDSINGR